MHCCRYVYDCGVFCLKSQSFVTVLPYLGPLYIFVADLKKKKKKSTYFLFVFVNMCAELEMKITVYFNLEHYAKHSKLVLPYSSGCYFYSNHHITNDTTHTVS